MYSTNISGVIGKYILNSRLNPKENMTIRNFFQLIDRFISLPSLKVLKITDLKYKASTLFELHQQSKIVQQDYMCVMNCSVDRSEIEMF